MLCGDAHSAEKLFVGDLGGEEGNCSRKVRTAREAEREISETGGELPEPRLRKMLPTGCWL